MNGRLRRLRRHRGTAVLLRGAAAGNLTKGDRAMKGQARILGPDAKAWLANGLEELRSVFTPNTQGVQLGNIPGTMLTPTTGEQTADRLAGDRAQVMEA